MNGNGYDGDKMGEEVEQKTKKKRKQTSDYPETNTYNVHCFSKRETKD